METHWWFCGVAGEKFAATCSQHFPQQSKSVKRSFAQRLPFLSHDQDKKFVLSSVGAVHTGVTVWSDHLCWISSGQLGGLFFMPQRQWRHEHDSIKPNQLAARCAKKKQQNIRSKIWKKNQKNNRTGSHMNTWSRRTPADAGRTAAPWAPGPFQLPAARASWFPNLRADAWNKRLLLIRWTEIGPVCASDWLYDSWPSVKFKAVQSHDHTWSLKEGTSPAHSRGEGVLPEGRKV